MALNALLMCHDQRSLQVLAAALDELEIEQEICRSAHQAMERLVQGYYSALVLDFDIPGAAQLAKLARMAPPRRRPVVFGMIGATTEIADAFQVGANFVTYKPLHWDQLMRSLRAGHGFMKSDQRGSKRHPLSTIVYMRLGDGVLPSMMLDLNHDGLAVQASEPLPALPEIPLRFVLPGSGHLVEGTGEVVWADDSGRAGIFFAKLTAASRKHLKQWLAKRDAKKTAGQVMARSERRIVATARPD